MAGSPTEYIKLPQSPSHPILSPNSEQKAKFNWPRSSREPQKRGAPSLRRRTPFVIGLLGLAFVALFAVSRSPSLAESRARLSSAWQQATANQTKKPTPASAPFSPQLQQPSTPLKRGRYLVAAYVNEQETKAQSHLYDLGLLARTLNRTLVLPNADHARFGPCHAHPFELFYEPDALSSFGIASVSQARFDQELGSVARRPTAQIVRLENDDRPESTPGRVEAATSWTDPDDFVHYRAPCLEGHNFDFSGRPMLEAGKPRWKPDFPREQVTEFGKSVVLQLREWEDKVGGTDVLLVEIMWREHVMTEEVANALAPDALKPALPFSFLEYGALWHEFAARIARHLSPFIAVHWRMETHPTEGLAECGVSLVDKLLDLQRQHPTVENVYVLMDYPLDSLLAKGEQGMIESGDAAANSDSFEDLGEVHHRAVAGFLREMAERAPSLRLTTTRQVQHQVAFPPAMAAQLAGVPTEGSSDLEPGASSPGLDQIDKSLVGLVDKMVASRAELFVSSAWHGSTASTCGRFSSFTRNILALRQEAFEKQRVKSGDAPGRLWLVGDLFTRNGAAASRARSRRAEA